MNMIIRIFVQDSFLLFFFTIFTIFGNFGPFLVILDHYGPFWAILDYFKPFLTVILNKLKFKYILNIQDTWKLSIFVTNIKLYFP